MFSEIDKTIFPDRCEVLEIVPQHHYVFPIFKCGKSSLYNSIPFKDWKILANDEIYQITENITVFLRDPKSRFISGVNTYLQHILRDNPLFDEKTILWFVDHYLFLNRHYCPQFYWLINLSRYINPDIKLKLESFLNVSELTHLNSSAGIKKPSQQVLDRINLFDWKSLEPYMFLDQILIDRIGQEFTFKELVSILYNDYRDLYNLIFKQSAELTTYVLPST